MAGLLAARILNDFFESVIVIDSDRLPLHAEARRGVPQSVQPHVLFARGYRILQALFPGVRSHDKCRSSHVSVVFGIF